MHLGDRRQEGGHASFAESVRRRDGAPPWVFYEGPPTANGTPGLHHVWARVYKDLFCRFQTMRGRLVKRRAGWDTHGLPVEVEVERRLAISGKRAIEDEVGIARFVELCRESVEVYVEDFEKLTRRIGYWVDFDAAYRTYAPEYVDSVWWHLKTIFDAGLLYEDLKVLPYCPRCETPLSSHELGQPDVYTEEADLSAYVRLALKEGPVAPPPGATSLLVWTTTPWTLLSNVGVAVNPSLTYAIVDGAIVAADLVDAVFGEGAVVLDATGARCGPPARSNGSLAGCRNPARASSSSAGASTASRYCSSTRAGRSGPGATTACEDLMKCHGLSP